MVIVPTILDSVARAEQLLAHLEVQALGNVDPHVHFALLTDFRDAASETLPLDAAILDAARSGIRALNAKHAPGAGDRFFLFHRHRQWNEGEGLWMGWERKRGKIEEFNRLLRGATDTSFVTTEGDLAVLPEVRYCITLDSDTRLPRDVGPSADRHHRAPAEPAGLRPARRPRHRGLRHPPAADQRHVRQRRRVAVRPPLRRPHRCRPVHDAPCPTPTRTCSARASSPARGSTTSTRSTPRSPTWCPRTRSCRTTCSRACTPASRWSPTSSWSTSTRRACSRTPGASTGGSAATGRSCSGCFRSCRRAAG